jgi:hypothetical protein
MIVIKTSLELLAIVMIASEVIRIIVFELVVYRMTNIYGCHQNSTYQLWLILWSIKHILPVFFSLPFLRDVFSLFA